MQRLWALIVVPVAIVLGITFGGCFRMVAEYSYVYIFSGLLIGATAAAAVRAYPIIAAIAGLAGSLMLVLIAKLIVGAPPGTSWIAYHTTLFDFLFCYIAAPIAAATVGGVGSIAIAKMWPPVNRPSA
jgi:hypothetical protein